MLAWALDRSAFTGRETARIESPFEGSAPPAGVRILSDGRSVLPIGTYRAGGGPSEPPLLPLLGLGRELRQTQAFAFRAQTATDAVELLADGSAQSTDGADSATADSAGASSRLVVAGDPHHH